MSKATTLLIAVLLILTTATVTAQDEGTTFTVTIENVSAPLGGEIATAEIFNTPVDAMEPGPALPGASYQFSFTAEQGEYLNFATMLVQSNDLFFAPVESGILLFDEAGDPISGDITDQVLLWDSGTEVNEEPGVGENQAPRQTGPDTGEAENGTVILLDNAMDGFEYPAVNELIRVTVDPMGNDFTVTIENISGDSALPSPLAPGVFAVGPQPTLFVEDEIATPGVEALAEDGNAAILFDEVTGVRLASPLSPGAFAVHSPDVALFVTGEPASAGIEANAEDGAAAPLLDELTGVEGVFTAEVFNTPVEAMEPGPAFPGQSYQFTFTAEPGAYLNFATMFVQSNDIFLAPLPEGIALFDMEGNPISGDITDQVLLWDAGTEVNEEPGVGANQAPRQEGPDTGEDEMGVIVLIDDVMDGFEYPTVRNIVHVTINVQ